MIKNYRGEYGELVVDFEKHEVIKDTLDREKIWNDSNMDYRQQSILYSMILDELLGEDASILATSIDTYKRWAGKATDFGFEVYLADGWNFLLDAEGSNFYKED